MGATGQVATEANLTAMAKDFMGSDWLSYYNRTKRWLGRRVFDCNGLCEGFYMDKTGKDINVRARDNYASWCSVKSSSAPDIELTGMPQMPGLALFSGPTAKEIGHVGFLLRKTGTGQLDWEVLEASGANYGVIITPLRRTQWRWWGVMDKYFEYDVGANTNEKPGTGTPPMQPVDGNAYFAVCGGNDVNVRTGRGTAFPTLGQLDKGDKMLALPEKDDWCAVSCVLGGKMVSGYMFSQYVRALE